MLVKDFYKIISTKNISDDEVLVQLEINASHEIFQAHFPGMPVTPGVCMLQMIKEIWEEKWQKSLQYSVLNQVKFLAVLDPFNTPIVEVKTSVSVLESGDFKILASILLPESITALKMSGELICI